MRTLVLGYCALIVVYGALLAAMVGLSGWKTDPRSTAPARAKSSVQMLVLVPGAVMCSVALGFLNRNLSTATSLLITVAALLAGALVFVIEASVEDHVSKNH